MRWVDRSIDDTSRIPFKQPIGGRVCTETVDEDSQIVSLSLLGGGALRISFRLRFRVASLLPISLPKDTSSF